MTTDLDLDGPTVTVFGRHDLVDQALSDELGHRGCSTHSVTVPVGWLVSASHAVIRLGSPAGEVALEQLCEQRDRASRIVAVAEEQADELASRRQHDLCRTCGDHHGVSLVRHPPLGDNLGDATALAARIALAVVDALGKDAPWSTVPSFATTVVHLDGPGASRS